VTAAATTVLADSERRSAFAAARQMCRRTGEGGGYIGGAYVASFFLPRAKRDGVYAVWAFARLIQHAVEAEGGSGDSCSGAGTVAPLLKSRIDAIYDSPHIELPLPQFRDESQWVLAATVETVRQFEIPQRLWHELIDGLLAFRGVQRIATWRSLDAHLEASGGKIGRIVSAVMGATHSDAGNFAAAVGRAAQLRAVLRDLKRDLSHDRVLLPLEDLARFRYSEREMLALTVNENFRALIRHEIGRVRDLFEEGVAGTCWLDGDGSRMAAAAFVSLQLGALDAIDREPDALLRNDDGIAGVKRPSLASQLRQLPRAWRIAKRRAEDPLPNLR
jgi:15-cis-phytoene synthase